MDPVPPVPSRTFFTRTSPDGRRQRSKLFNASPSASRGHSATIPLFAHSRTRSVFTRFSARGRHRSRRRTTRFSSKTFPRAELGPAPLLSVESRAPNKSESVSRLSLHRAEPVAPLRRVRCASGFVPTVASASFLCASRSPSPSDSSPFEDNFPGLRVPPACPSTGLHTNLPDPVLTFGHSTVTLNPKCEAWALFLTNNHTFIQALLQIVNHYTNIEYLGTAASSRAH